MVKLSFGGSKSKQKTQATSVSNPNVPGYIQQPVTDYYGQVHSAMNGTQPQTYGPSSLQTQAFNGASALGGANSNVTQGADAIRQGISYQPQNVQAGQLSSTDLSPYMDPYNRQVVDAFMGDWAHGNELGLNSLRSAATRSNAYGGSRDAVAQGQLIGDNSRTLAGTLAALRSGGFQSAQEAAKGDIANRLSADTFNANMGLQGAQFRQGAGESLANLGLSGDANTRANLGLAGDLGAQQRDIAQQGDPAQARARWLAQMQALLGLNPAALLGNTTNETGKTTGSNIGFNASASLFGG